ncbi:MAG: hypothetical protein RLO81_20155, partial [Fulvivirga sp.]|uniref:hypothetical protein n=1 Tax=Fulvivirga sp. TaxID=1931237 RepID=UPI0032EBBFEC
MEKKERYITWSTKRKLGEITTGANFSENQIQNLVEPNIILEIDHSAATFLLKNCNFHKVVHKSNHLIISQSILGELELNHKQAVRINDNSNIGKVKLEGNGNYEGDLTLGIQGNCSINELKLIKSQINSLSINNSEVKSFILVGSRCNKLILEKFLSNEFQFFDTLIGDLSVSDTDFGRSIFSKSHSSIQTFTYR